MARIPVAAALIVAMLAPAAAAAQPQPAAWRVQLVSEGGLTGRGAGSLAAMSDGTLQLLAPAAGRPRPSPAAPGGAEPAYEATCTLKLTPEQMIRLSGAVAAARPTTWAPRYTPPNNPNGCCDEITWRLTFERTPATGPVERRVVLWVAEREGLLPADLAALRSALLAAKPEGECPMEQAARPEKPADAGRYRAWPARSEAGRAAGR